MNQNKYSTSIIDAVNILGKWGLSESEKAEILGLDSVIELSELEMTFDLTERCSLVNAINTSLEVCFSNVENVNGYMAMVNHNHPYVGKRPVDLALAGIDGLRAVDQEVAKLMSALNQ